MNDPVDSVRRSFVPTWEAVREALLGPYGRHRDEEMVSQHLFAAVLICARSLRRRSWTNQVELGPALLERLRTRTPPPTTGLESAHYAILERLVDPLPRRCTGCPVRAKTTTCSNCSGGMLTPLVACPPSCDGGWIPCPTCEGTGLVQAAVVRHIEEDITLTRAVALPRLSAFHWLEDRLHAEALRTGMPPLALALQAATSGSAYRGGKPAPPRFLELPIAEAWDAARDKAEALQRSLAASQVEFRAFGWPVWVGVWYGVEIAAALGFDWTLRIFPRALG